MNLAPASLSARAWLVVGLLWVVASLNYLDRVMITTMRASLIEAIPMTDAQFGLLTSVFLWVYAFLSPFAGYLADRFSRSRIVIFSLLVWSVVTWLTGHAKTFDQLLITRALMGISEAFYIPAALALIVDYHRGATRSRATSIHLTGFTVGSGLGGLGGWLAERHGWNSAFLVFGVFGAVYSIVLLFLLRDAPPEIDRVSPAAEAPPKPDFFAAITSLFTSRGFLLVLIVWGLLGLAGWGLVGWLPTYFGERFRLGQGEAGFSATGCLAAATFAGALIGGAWADRWQLTNARGRILVPVIGLLVAGPAVYFATITGALPIAIACVMLYGVTRTFTDGNLMPILCLVVNPRYRATGMGLLNLFANLVGGLTIYAGGALRDAKVNVNHVFQFAAGGLLLCALLLFLVKPSAEADLPPNVLPK
jgi:predicted MFS family arabinose efflux permease